MWRNLGAVAAGVLVVGVVVTVLQSISLQLYPMPEGLDPMDPADAEAFAEHVAGLPATAWGIAFASEVVGALLGSLAAGVIAWSYRNVFAGAIVLLALAGSVLNWTAFSHPVWFMVGQVVAYALVLFLVVRFLGSLRPAGAKA